MGSAEGPALVTVDVRPCSTSVRSAESGAVILMTVVITVDVPAGESLLVEPSVLLVEVVSDSEHPMPDRSPGVREGPVISRTKVGALTQATVHRLNLVPCPIRSKQTKAR